jgi:hypothetical protein
MSFAGQCRHHCNLFSQHTSLELRVDSEKNPIVLSFVFVRFVSRVSIETGVMAWQFLVHGGRQMVTVCPVNGFTLGVSVLEFDVRSHERIMTLHGHPCTRKRERHEEID